MTKIGFDPQSLGFPARHIQGADFGGAGGDNALPLMVRRKFIGETPD